MKLLLTPDQQSTLWHLSDHLMTTQNEKLYFFPYFLRDCGNGEYERLTYDQLSEEAKDMILSQQGIKRTA